MSTKRAALYVRQSRSDTEGIDGQLKRTRALAEMRHWTVAGVYEDDDVSASKPRGPQTAWGRMMNDAAAGRLDVVVAVDLDRLLRSTRDLNTLIDAGLLAVTVDGEIDLTTADGEFRATMLAGVARFEVRRKAERQQRAAARRAESGAFARGTRLTGYTSAGVPHPVEAPIVAELFERFIDGQPMTQLAAWLEDGVLPSRNGQPWRGTTVRRILKNPRYCARQTYQRATTGRMGSWEPIVSEATFDAAQAILNDPRRLTHQSGSTRTARKYLGSGIYRCGECGRRMNSRSGGSTPTGSYGCPNKCLTRVRGPVDDYVRKVVAAWIGTQSDLDLSPQQEQASELPGLRTRLAQVESDYDNDLIDARRYQVKRDKILTLIDTAAAKERRLHTASAVTEVLVAPDPAQMFLNAPIGVQQAVIDEFMDVRLLRGRKGGYRVFDPETVEIEWRSG